MGIEDELRARANAQESAEQTAARQSAEKQAHRDNYVNRALDETRAVALEANRVLLNAGVKPARLKSYRPQSLFFPTISKMMGDLDHGQGWAVLDHVVVDTNGHLWSTRYHGAWQAEKLRGNTRIYVNSKGGLGHIPTTVYCDEQGLYSTAYDSREDSYRVEFLDRLKDGYAQLLRFHGK